MANSKLHAQTKAGEWNKAYLEAIIDELHPVGEVLQVGFDLGNAAKKIQTYHPKSHIIIEKDPMIAKEANIWAGKHSNVTVLEGAWKDFLPTLGVFDVIFFNDYPFNCGMDMIKRLNRDEAASTANQAKELLKTLEEGLSQITAQYSDEEIEDFYQKIGQFYPKEMPQFFTKLKENSHISDQQYKNVLKKHHIEAANAKEETDPMLEFLDECLNKHMRKGSRFSSFVCDIISKYEDAQFFDRIITNPNLDFHEKFVSIKIPDYEFDQALVIIVKKL